MIIDVPVDYNLIIHNVISVLAFISTSGLGILLLLQNYRRTLNVTFALVNFSVALFYLSHIFGVNASDAATAFSFFQYNWLNIGIVVFNAHFFFAIINETDKHRVGIWVTYISGALLAVYCFLFPEMFFLEPVAKMYMPFYYVPGPMYIVLRTYCVIVPLYLGYYFFRAYTRSQGGERVRLKFVAYSLLFGYIVGTTAIFPFYDIPFDPAISMLFGFYTIPFAYAIFRYEVLEIRIVARRALVYAGIIVSTGIFFILITTVNSLIVTSMSGFPIWIIPAIAGIGTVIVGSIIWNRFREIDTLKYEFINVVTHRFRTPLTSIKWSLDILKNPTASEVDKRQAITSLGGSHETLSDLIQTLSEAYQADTGSYRYVDTKTDIKKLIEDIILEKKNSAKTTLPKITLSAISDLPLLVVDPERIRFVLQILLTNALAYTPTDKTIHVTLSANKHSLFCSIKDEGIGIAKENLSYVFSRFFRGNEAKRKDTEGNGIGLSLAYGIMTRHGGTIIAKSEGLGKGSEFIIKLPIE